MNKQIAIVGIVMAIIIGVSAYFIISVFTKAPAEADEIKPEYYMEAGILFKEYEADEEGSNVKYLDKVIQVKGSITEIFTNNSGDVNLLLKDEEDFGGINCSFAENQQEYLKGLTVGDTIILKGFCSGMLMDVVLNRCLVVE